MFKNYYNLIIFSLAQTPDLENEMWTMKEKSDIVYSGLYNCWKDESLSQRTICKVIHDK